MKNSINLDPIIRKVNGQSTIVAGEEVVVTVDLVAKKAIQKTFLVRLGGNYQDYLVANDRNPTRTAAGKFSPYFVRDTRNERTLSLEIGVTASCPVGHEVKVAESLSGDQTPSQVFGTLIERWTSEFIPFGDEGRFIDSYDAARRQLEIHLATRAMIQTGLHLLTKVALCGESDVPKELVVGPVEIGVRLHDYKGEQSLIVEAGLTLDSQNYVNAFVYQEALDNPEVLFKRHLKDYFSERVTFQQFGNELQYAHFKQPLQQALSNALQRVGRRVSFINFPTDDPGNKTVKPPPEFVAITYNHRHEVVGRTQPIDIKNTVQLYLENSAAFVASRITDLDAWTKSTLNEVLKRHLIGQTYVELLLRFDRLEESIKRDLSSRTSLKGYKVDHLVSLPNLKERELSEPFLLELEETFETKLDGFEVQLKFSVKLRIRHLESIEKYLNLGTDVKEAIGEAIISEARECLRNVLPERFYLNFNRPDEATSSDSKSEEDRMAVKDLLSQKISEILEAKFDAEISYLTLRIGRSELRDRHRSLCYEIRQFRVDIESPDPQGTESLALTGDFEIRGVHPDSASWQRFSALRLNLDGLQRQLETHLRAELKPYFQSGFMFQNRTGRGQVYDLVSNYADVYMKREFGLIVRVTNIDRNTTGIEVRQRQMLIELESDKVSALEEQGQRLINKLRELRAKRVVVLSAVPIDKETLQETNQSIELLEAELESITTARFGTHRLATTLEGQLPDAIPQRVDTGHMATQYELESVTKRELPE